MPDVCPQCQLYGEWPSELFSCCQQESIAQQMEGFRNHFYEWEILSQRNDGQQRRVVVVVTPGIDWCYTCFRSCHFVSTLHQHHRYISIVQCISSRSRILCLRHGLGQGFDCRHTPREKIKLVGPFKATRGSIDRQRAHRKNMAR